MELQSCIQRSHKNTLNFVLNRQIRNEHNYIYDTERFYTALELDLYYCKFCIFKSQLKLSLHKHLTFEHEKRNNKKLRLTKAVGKMYKLKCQHCPFQTNSKLYFVKHYGQCKRNASYTTSTFLIGNKLFNCEQCSFQTKRESNLTLHVKKRHSCKSKVKLNSCEQCSYKSNRNYISQSEFQKYSCKRHLTEPGYPKSLFKCNQCSYKSKTRSSLKQHKLYHHTPLNQIKWFHCVHCSYKAKLQKNIKYHIRNMHTPSNKITWYHCEQCSYKAKEKQNLKTHILKMHTPVDEIVWFNCTLCSYKAKEKRHIKYHILNKHTPSNKISWIHCEQCSYKAKVKQNLKSHIRNRHTPANEIVWICCEQCSYKAKRNVQLKEHVRVHHTQSNKNQTEVNKKQTKGPSWIQCEQCSFETLSKNHLEKHLQLVHGSTSNHSLKIDWLRCEMFV